MSPKIVWHPCTKDPKMDPNLDTYPGHGPEIPSISAVSFKVWGGGGGGGGSLEFRVQG